LAISMCFLICLFLVLEVNTLIRFSEPCLVNSFSPSHSTLVCNDTEAEAFADKSMQLVKDAVELYPGMPMIPDSPITHSKFQTLSLLADHINCIT
jgi:hypothetical protein